MENENFIDFIKRLTFIPDCKLTCEKNKLYQNVFFLVHNYLFHDDTTLLNSDIYIWQI
jgi:hypothetical protein